jgi:glycosyltransferase involved in cell wall biosynthesis
VVPFGLNLEAAPEPRLDVAAPARGEPLRLVFIGKDWARKGGEIALGALRWLRAQGADARLTVLGSRPPGGAAEAGEPGLEVIPFLDKNRPRDAARFAGILGAAHLLVLPTRADCTPMVVAEANSFGVPALATDLGGLGTLVAAGETGRLIPPAAGGAEWGRQVLEATADPAAYAALRRAAHARYRRRLTWEAWSDGVLEVAAGLPAPVPDRAAG